MLNKIVGGVVATLMMAGVASAEKVLTFGTQENEASPMYQGMVAMNDALKDVSGGEMSLKLFASSTLGDFKAMVAQAQAGELDLVMTGYPDMSYIIPELKLIGAPYVVSDFDHLKELIAGEFGQKMDEAFTKQGVKVMDVWYLGTRQTTSNRPINSVEDMEGLRLRTPNVPFLIAFAENTGASPAPVAFAEVYLALQTNQVDAQENPLPTIEAMKFYEVQDHIALTSHFVASAAIQVGMPTWDNLTDQEKEWLNEAIAKGGEVANKIVMDKEESLIADFEAKGLTITRPDTGPFRDAMQPYYDELEAQFGEGSISALFKK
ncbi:DctP family TRAP transporter solute-binding subunit [Aliiroseovarius sediminis]|uniref:DctP family TRAP transporter solute-binding subunit n=1 Tax=Aliiroseovarius sediminis TaxID=2925839 RepID=UPI001F5767F8|nr:DctP family TRAP transporter solute-binding subunit [Aliiroseovarius sediminis]MCI2393978.1 DctP family TRAP transporter solute-binding subunit [Aliiroseovarius sediminis]